MKTMATRVFLLAACALGGCALPRVPVIDASMQECVDHALRNGPDPTVLVDAAARFDAGCEAGDPAACSLLGLMRERGLAMRPDLPGARALYQRACRAGNTIGCVHLHRTSWGVHLLLGNDRSPPVAATAAEADAAR
jgi:TPR repeat protein